MLTSVKSIGAESNSRVSIARKFSLFLTVLAVITPTSAALATSFSDQFAQLDPLRRAAVMRRAVIDSGQRCGRVTNITKQGAYKNMAMWSARCAPGGDYAAFIGLDGSVQVRPCADLAKLKLPLCQIRTAK